MATYVTPLSSGKVNPRGANPVMAKLFTSSGVIGATALQVSAQLTPNKTVLISGSEADDMAVFVLLDGRFIQAWNDADYELTITDNNSGVTKTDAVVSYVDLDDGDAVNANNPDALKFIAVRRGGVDTGAPTGAEIDTAVSGNPYIVLDHLTLANGYNEITASELSDPRVQAQVAKEVIEPIGPDQVDQTGDFTVASLTATEALIGAQFYTTTVSGSIGSTTDFTITLPSSGTSAVYLITANAVGSNVEIGGAWIVVNHTPDIRCGIAQLINADYNLGSLALTTKDGGGQNTFSAGQGGAVRLTVTPNGTTSYRYTVMRLTPGV